jgi:hypothetical protein
MKEEANLMNCSEFNAIVADLSRPGAVSQEASAAALAHAESCSWCAALLTETESLEFALRSLAARDADWQAPARVEAALLREFRRAREIQPRRAVRWPFAAAAAAVILLAAGFSFRHGFLHSPSSGKDTGVAVNPPQSGPAVAAPADAPGIHPAANAANDPSNTESPQRPRQIAGAEPEGAFMALPYTDDLDMLEGGAIVRVNLSRAALASFGLPVSDVGDAEQIPADVVVSADGTPEAVRLVSQVMPAENILEK